MEDERNPGDCMTYTFPSIRWYPGRTGVPGQDPLPVEEPLVIELNGRRVAMLMRLPGMEKELAAGFCLTEGLVLNPDDLSLIHHCGSRGPGITPDGEKDALESRNQVRVIASRVLRQRRPDTEVLLIRAGCGRVGLEDMEAEIPRIDTELLVRADILGAMVPTMAKAQVVKKVSGGVHSAAIFTAAGELVIHAEDVGRHNAMDKVFGYAILRGIPLHDKVLITTGRASYEMVTKAARAGLPVVASIAAATTLAVEYAQQARMTLISYLRANTFRVYTHAWRVVMHEATTGVSRQTQPRHGLGSGGESLSSLDV